MKDEIGAFVPGTSVRIQGRLGGPLSGLTFAAKDLFDVAGHPTGGGNPDWAAQNPIPDRHSWAVQRLLDAGGTLIGKTITDEISLGLMGDNPFFGTPLNSEARGYIPGGSSSGSAAAVAARICDTALGTDTGGSVRVPASFCGLYGIRPTHGRLPLNGMMSQAPSSDTTGWLAKEAEVFAEISSVLLGNPIPQSLPTRLLIAADAFSFADKDTAAALVPMVDRLGSLIGEASIENIAPQGLSTWARAQELIQGDEAWRTFRPWIERENPRLAFSVAARLLRGASVSDRDLAWARLMRREAKARLSALLDPGTIMCLPTTPFPAPKQNRSLNYQSPIRDQILCLCAHGGLAGMPQVSIPGTKVGGLPIGLSVVGRQDSDETLVAVARALQPA